MAYFLATGVVEGIANKRGKNRDPKTKNHKDSSIAIKIDKSKKDYKYILHKYSISWEQVKFEIREIF